jgi:hypothetical protein
VGHVDRRDDFRVWGFKVLGVVFDGFQLIISFGYVNIQTIFGKN